MSDKEKQLYKALVKIAEVASIAVNGDEHVDHAHYDDDVHDDDHTGDVRVCTPKTLPKRLLLKAAETARSINPVNAPVLGPLAALGLAVPSDPLFISVMTSKYWGATPRRLTVSFMESTPANLRARIVSHMNAWTQTGCISFVETQGTGDVRISRGAGGYWSYLGTDIRLIPRNRQTMNLQGFTMSTPESEYKRVVRHETGHTLGAPHEHMRKALVARIDRAKAYEYFLRTQGWNKQMVDAQVLTPLDEASIMSTPADQTSIMCYQLPGEITRDGRPIVGGLDINATDFAFIGRIYPKPGHAVQHEHDVEEWDASEDVEEVAA
jgi:Astacin (Peptidase family M12A)